MTDMFCFQCEQTAKGTGCTVSGVCGKKPEVAHKHDELVCALIGMAAYAWHAHILGKDDPEVTSWF